MVKQSGLQKLWQIVRQICAGANGQYAFEAYQAHQRDCHPERPALDRAEYEKCIRLKRYEGMTRCC